MPTRKIKKNQTLFWNTDFLTYHINLVPKKEMEGVRYFFEHSNRENSNTLYICFKYGNTYKEIVNTRLRISDHTTKTPYKTFLINPQNSLSDKDLLRFKRTVINICRSLKLKYTKRTIEYINKK